jgi:hypothetical protein
MKLHLTSLPAVTLIVLRSVLSSSSGDIVTDWNAQDGWRTSVTNISSFAGQNVSLAFSIDSGGDPDFLLQSSLAIDNVGISPVPEPGAAVLLAGVPAVAAFRRRRKGNA